MTMPTFASSVSATGSWNVMPKAKISFITRSRYSLTRGSSSIGTPPPPVGVWKLAKNCQANGKHEVVGQRRAHQEQHRRRDQERQQRALLAAIQAGRDEQPDLRWR